ncbi:MAG TPA: ABC transporter ATP-binding protein [Bauldia sp.]|nr:ABC transporter ATP-binding protein [Bauldia sp.]
MSEVELRGVKKRFGPVEAIKKLDLTVEKGQFCALLGPSGCGKSTLLRMIAGLEQVTEGTILIGGNDVTNVPPAKRRIAMVFQSYALYPHMTVAQNISFSLRVAKAPKDLVKRRTEEVARMLQLSELLQRKPAQLSGGQRQRVAIGRALVREPEVFLFDEPLSNLDAMLRVQMRVEIARLHQNLKTTMIYVTHDQVEAMTLADKIVVLDHGEISQVGSPMELYQQPENKFVASFIGSPTMNFVAAEAQKAEGPLVTLGVPGGHQLTVKTRRGRAGDRPVELGIRPEHVRLGKPDDPQISLPGTVQILERLGNATIMYVDTPAGQIVVQDDGDVTAHAGENVGVIFDPSRVHVFNNEARVV